MSKVQFWIGTSGINASEVFESQVEAARAVFGAGVHTGTIADKYSFRPEWPRPGEAAETCARRCLNDATHGSSDVLAPAAYVNAGPGFYFGRNGQPAPRDILRQPLGRLAFAHSELEGNQNWPAAVREGRRAAQQMSAIA